MGTVEGQSPYLLTPPPADVGWVRDTVLSNTTEEDFDGADKVYVSRTGADLRQVVNEPEVLTVLERKGFEPYVLSELSVAEQAELFAGLDAVVAPHGTGLSNLVYGDDLTVVELFLDTAVRPFFFVHAMERGFGYACVVCEQRGSDMVVDTEELRSVVEAV